MSPAIKFPNKGDTVKLYIQFISSHLEKEKKKLGGTRVGY